MHAGQALYTLSLRRSQPLSSLSTTLPLAGFPHSFRLCARVLQTLTILSAGIPEAFVFTSVSLATHIWVFHFPLSLRALSFCTLSGHEVPQMARGSQYSEGVACRSGRSPRRQVRPLPQACILTGVMGDGHGGASRQGASILWT